MNYNFIGDIIKENNNISFAYFLAQESRTLLDLAVIWILQYFLNLNQHLMKLASFTLSLKQYLIVK